MRFIICQLGKMPLKLPAGDGAALAGLAVRHADADALGRTESRLVESGRRDIALETSTTDATISIFKVDGLTLK
jgi:hypothetical protein